MQLGSQPVMGSGVRMAQTPNLFRLVYLKAGLLHGAICSTFLKTTTTTKTLMLSAMKIECQWQWTSCAINSFLWLLNTPALPYYVTSHKSHLLHCMLSCHEGYH